MTWPAWLLWREKWSLWLPIFRWDRTKAHSTFFLFKIFIDLIGKGKKSEEEAKRKSCQEHELKESSRAVWSGLACTCCFSPWVGWQAVCVLYVGARGFFKDRGGSSREASWSFWLNPVNRQELIITAKDLQCALLGTYNVLFQGLGQTIPEQFSPPHPRPLHPLQSLLSRWQTPLTCEEMGKKEDDISGWPYPCDNCVLQLGSLSKFYILDPIYLC